MKEDLLLSGGVVGVRVTRLGRAVKHAQSVRRATAPPWHARLSADDGHLSRVALGYCKVVPAVLRRNTGLRRAPLHSQHSTPDSCSAFVRSCLAGCYCRDRMWRRQFSDCEARCSWNWRATSSDERCWPWHPTIWLGEGGPALSSEARRAFLPGRQEETRAELGTRTIRNRTRRLGLNGV